MTEVFQALESSMVPSSRSGASGKSSSSRTSADKAASSRSSSAASVSSVSASENDPTDGLNTTEEYGVFIAYDADLTAPAQGDSRYADIPLEDPESSDGQSARPAKRDLEKWPIFSERHPWRHLRFAAAEDSMTQKYAGTLIWEPVVSHSPLQQMLGR